MADDRPTPLDSDIPGGFPQTPAAISRQPSQASYTGLTRPEPGTRLQSHAESTQEGAALASITTPSSGDTAVASHYPSGIPAGVTSPTEHPTEEVERRADVSPVGSRDGDQDVVVKSEKENQRPTLSRQVTEDDVYAHLRRRSTTASKQEPLSRATTQDDADEQAEINRLMSRMFGKTRQANSEEERTRHRGVVFKDLTVKGMGVGAALQPTFGDVFLGLPRTLYNVFTKGPRKAAGKPPVKTIIDNFNGVIRPGEMTLVLGRPGSGCSTFLKIIGNQRFGYESIEGDVLYGGTDAKSMLKKYRGEVSLD